MLVTDVKSLRATRNEAYRMKTECRNRVRLKGGVLREREDGVIVSSGRVKASDGNEDAGQQRQCDGLYGIRREN